MFCNTFWTIPNQSIVELCERVGRYYIRIMAIISDVIFLMMRIELIDIMKIMMMKKSSQYFTTRTVKKQQQKNHELCTGAATWPGWRKKRLCSRSSRLIRSLGKHSWLSKVLHVDIFWLEHQGEAERTKQGNLLTNQVLGPGSREFAMVLPDEPVN